MLTRARNARTLARSAAAAFTPHGSGRCCCCSMAAARRNGRAMEGTGEVSRPRSAGVQPIDWGQPSTSAIPYSPPPSVSQTRSYSTASRDRPRDEVDKRARRVQRRPKPHGATAAENPFTLLETVLGYERESDRNRDLSARLLPAFDQLQSDSTAYEISRAEWSSLFSRVAALYPSPSDTPPNYRFANHTRRFVSAILKRLREYAVAPPRGWELDLDELQTLFQVRLDKEEGEQRGRVGRFGLGAGGKGQRVTRERWEFLDVLGQEVFELASWEVRRARQLGRGGGHEWTLSMRFDGFGSEGLDMEDWRRRRSDWENVAELLERYSLTLSNRLPPSPPSCSHPLAKPDLALALRASTIYHTAHTIQRLLSLSALSPPPDLDPHPSLTASLPLPFLFASSDPSHRTLALRYLSSCLSHGKLLTAVTIRHIITCYYGDPPYSSSANEDEADSEASYLRARQILSSVCDDPSPFRRREAVGAPSKLDELLKLRLQRVERQEELDKEPTLAMIRWLGRELTGEGEGEKTRTLEERQRALDVAMRYWETSQALGRGEWDVGALSLPRSPVAKLLRELIGRACELEEIRRAATGSSGQDLPPPSPCIATAIRVAIAYLPRPLLTSLSVPLLKSVTTSCHSPRSALSLFEALSAPPPPLTPANNALMSAPEKRPYAPFTWTVSLLPSFTSLFFSAASPSSSRADSSLAMRLYFSWTAAGLSFPVGLWNALWRAAGRKGDVDEVERLVRDWEETGRGQVTGRIIRIVVEASAEEPPSRRLDPASPPLADASLLDAADFDLGPPPSRRAAVAESTPDHILPSLRLLQFFRSRYAPTPSSPPSPHFLAPHSQTSHLLVPLPAYTSLLRLLSRSRLDRRSAFRLTWSQMFLDGHRPSVECYNAAIAINVWRPEPGFSAEDVDRAGVVYNRLVEEGRRVEGVRPDRETYSLLLHGFMRVAERSRERRTTAKRRRVVLEAGLRTFEAAHQLFATAGVGVVGVRGHQTAKLVRLLAQEGRFEEAKVVQEKWWRSFVDFEGRSKAEQGKEGERRKRLLREEGREMERVRGEVERLEQRMGREDEGGRGQGRG
ncbi:hypothetical protein JCM11251_005269 [Rhodosporidiobolus azoricus]